MIFLFVSFVILFTSLSSSYPDILYSNCKNSSVRVPAVVQWVIKDPALSLWFSGLRIQHCLCNSESSIPGLSIQCCRICCSGCSCSCGSDLILGPGTSICLGCSQKKKIPMFSVLVDITLLSLVSVAYDSWWFAFLCIWFFMQ